MSGGTWWSKKFGPKLLSDLVIILLDFDESIRVVTLKHLMHFLTVINTK